MSILTHKKTSAELAVATADLALSASAILELEARLEDATKSADALAVDLKQAEADLVAKVSELDATKVELAESVAKQSGFDDLVNKKVIATLSSKGTIPAPEAATDEETFSDLKAEYEKLPKGQARIDFRKANRSLFQ